MRTLIGALCLAFAATGVNAQDKKEPSRRQASDKKLKGDERKKFMSTGLKG